MPVRLIRNSAGRSGDTTSVSRRARTLPTVWAMPFFRWHADLSGDVRIAYVSCNGQESAGGVNRRTTQRDVAPLAEEHARTPFAYFAGGDQLYADEVFQSRSGPRAMGGECEEGKDRPVFSARHAQGGGKSLFSPVPYASISAGYRPSECPSAVAHDVG